MKYEKSIPNINFNFTDFSNALFRLYQSACPFIDPPVDPYVDPYTDPYTDPCVDPPVDSYVVDIKIFIIFFN